VRRIEKDAVELPMPSGNVFPRGARVFIDGRDIALVKEAYPRGSSSFLFAHYKLDIIDGDQNVAVAWSRVGVTRKGTER
jgi:hypothetical protein